MATKKGVSLLLVGLLVMAGCFGATDDDPDPVADIVDVVPDGGDHDHLNFSHHEISTPNMEFIDWDTLGTTGGADVTVHGDYAYATAWQDMYIVNVSDPSDLSIVSTYTDTSAQIKDAKVVGDGDYVLINNEFADLNIDPERPPPDSPQPMGLMLIDVQDKANPFQVAGWQSNSRAGPHNQVAHQIDGEWYVFVAMSDLGTVPGGGVKILHLDLGPIPTFREVGSFVMDYADSNGGIIFTHDMVIQDYPAPDHPVHGGKTYMYVAYWDAGVRIVDVTNPPDQASVEYITGTWEPQEVGSWYEDLVPEDNALSNIHYTEPMPQMIEFEDGTWHHITVASPELASGTGHTGVIWVLDTTDFDAIEVLGTWELSDERPFGSETEINNEANYRFSPHNFDIANGRLYLAHMHAGVWVLDLSTEEALHDPQPVGYYVPHGPQDPEDMGVATWGAIASGMSNVPFLWGIEYDRGFIYTMDISTGLYVLQFDEDRIFDDRE